MKLIAAAFAVLFFAACGKSDPSETSELQAIRFENSQYDIYQGETVAPQLYVTMRGQAQESAYDHAANLFAFVWTSSDTSVATVSDDGTVLGLKAGVVTLKARSARYNKSVTTQIEVLPLADGQIESMRFELPSYSVEAFSTVTPKIFVKFKNQAEAVYDDAVDSYGLSWTPADKTVISVSESGVVTGLKSGTTNLTVSTPLYARTITASVTCTTSWVGEWKMESWKGEASMAGKVYMDIASSGFKLYQNIDKPGFTTYTGSYTLALESGKLVLNGKYSDNTAWADKYEISISNNKEQLTMTGLTFGVVSVYSRSTIPSHVKSSAAKAVRSAGEKPFL